MKTDRPHRFLIFPPGIVCAEPGEPADRHPGRSFRGDPATPASPGATPWAGLPFRPASSGLLSGRSRHRNLRAHGGGASTQGAVDLSLHWLASVQEEGGSWGTVTETAVALLAFLGTGETDHHGQYRDTVRRGLESLASRRGADSLLATAVFVEVYGIHLERRWREEAMARIRRREAELPGLGPDARIEHGLVLLLARECGLRVDPAAIDHVRRRLGDERGPVHEAMAAFFRSRLGESVSWSPPFRPAAADPLRLQAATTALFAIGSPDWPRWNEEMRRRLVGSQREDGSWGGDVLETALAAGTLEVYYRYARERRPR